MTSESVDQELVAIALDRVDGFAFERFASSFVSAIEGGGFTPLGGMHDGGADGFFRENIHESSRAGSFYQFTIQKDHRSKIRGTVKRLREFDRSPRALYYVTSIDIPHSDAEEDLLTEELGVVIRIRDRSYISSHINDSSASISAYNNNLSTYTKFLSKIGGSDDVGVSRHVSDPSVYVFLQHEISNRLGERKLVHSIMDTLILWALRDTDPDLGVFMGRDQIVKEILNQFPWSRQFISAEIDHRLSSLRAKSLDGREVRWYSKKKKYCLPFETREIIRKENIEEETIRIRYIRSLEMVASEIVRGGGCSGGLVAELVDSVILKAFESQGLLLANYISRQEDDGQIVLSDIVEEVLDLSSVKPEDFPSYRLCVERVLTSLFYNSSPDQRVYLQSLAKTYVLLFTLKAEPRIIEFFGNMGSNFNLFVGSDILVKAISERYLDEADQSARLLLVAAKECGMKLKLSELVLDEVYTHIRNTNFEFVNFFSEIEPYVTREIARNSDKILIRAYFYAKERRLVGGWKSYLEQFITYNNIASQSGREEIKRYLISQYGLVFVENDYFESMVDLQKVGKLTDILLANGDKENEKLARNSALLVHGIYGIRRRQNEQNSGSPFGFNTWWLTNQTRIQRHTFDLVRANFAKYIMRPEFVLNFIALAPSCKQVRETQGRLLPSGLGMQLGHRLRDDVMKNVLGMVKQWKELQPGRINALISQLSDQLKSDQFKVYEVTIESLNKLKRESGIQ